MSSAATRRLQQTFIGCLCCMSVMSVCDVRLCLCPDSLTYFGDLLRRTAPKFGTHVRIDTLTLKFVLTHHTPGGFRGLSIVKNLSRRTAPKFDKHVRIDTLTLKKNNLTHPTPGGFRGLSIVKNLSRRTVPKFGTHVRIDTLTFKKKLTHPTPPQGGLGG